MLVKAAGPRRSHNCARYKLAGVTCVPVDSKIPLGSRVPFPPGSEALISVPTQPMHQLSTPGGCCTKRKGVLTFHATAQPTVQPCPEPEFPRSRKAIPGVCVGALGMLAPSASKPVYQRVCGEMPAACVLVKFRTAAGPVPIAAVTRGQSPVPLDWH